MVEATDDIPDCTLICEYVGEVNGQRPHLFDVASDDLMDLLRSGRSKTSLVICPAKKGNLARFLGGVNNARGPEVCMKRYIFIVVIYYDFFYFVDLFKGIACGEY